MPARPGEFAARGLWVMMVASVLRGGFVWEDLVVGHVVPVHIVAGRTADGRRAGSEIADQRRHRDIHDVVSETAAIRPTARHRAAPKTGLNRAGQGIAAED